MARTALVLGGGGITGIGWQTGMLYGLAEAGVDLSSADLVVGTSAGSVVGAQLTSGAVPLRRLYERQLAPASGEISASLGSSTLLRYARHALTSRTPEEYGRRLGALALTARTPPEEERREVIAGRLLSHRWPDRQLTVTAVDALSGELRSFTRDSGVPVVDAVAASCAVPGVWPAVTIGGRRWIDGGMHSVCNVQLAADCERVLVLAPLTVGLGPVATPRAQAERLEERGVRVAVLTPSSAARRAFGRNSLDPARRAPSARAGRAQAALHRQQVVEVWHG